MAAAKAEMSSQETKSEESTQNASNISLSRVPTTSSQNLSGISQTPSDSKMRIVTKDEGKNEIIHI